MLFDAYMRGKWDTLVAMKSNWCVYCLDILRCRFVSAQPLPTISRSTISLPLLRPSC